MTDNTISSSKVNIGKKTAIRDMEDEVEELPDVDFSKSFAGIFI